MWAKFKFTGKVKIQQNQNEWGCGNATRLRSEPTSSIVSFYKYKHKLVPPGTLSAGLQCCLSTIGDRDEQHSVVSLSAYKAQWENQPCNPDIQLSLSTKVPLQKCQCLQETLTILLSSLSSGLSNSVHFTNKTQNEICNFRKASL